MWRSIVSLMIFFPLVIALLLFSLKFVQKFSTPLGNNRQLKIIEQLRLTPKTNISIIKVGNQHLVISSSEEQVHVIRELTQEEVEDLEQNQKSMALNQIEAVEWKNIVSRWKFGKKD